MKVSLVGNTEEEGQEEVQEEEQEASQQAEDEEVQAEVPATLSTDQEEGIATNIKVKEVLSRQHLGTRKQNLASSAA